VLQKRLSLDNRLKYPLWDVLLEYATSWSLAVGGQELVELDETCDQSHAHFVGVAQQCQLKYNKQAALSSEECGR
jgi:hypothetical protein